MEVLLFSYLLSIVGVNVLPFLLYKKEKEEVVTLQILIRTILSPLILALFLYFLILKIKKIESGKLTAEDSYIG